MGLDDIEYRLASKLAQKVEGKLLDSATKAITDPILGIFGLGGTTDPDLYFKEVNERLDAIKLSIDELSRKMDGIGNEIEGIDRTETVILGQLKGTELDLILQAYTSDANLIEQNFQTFTRALGSMTDRAQFEPATKELFQLFGVNNLDAIGGAMRNIYARFVGAQEMKGIIDFQSTICEQALIEWAGDVRNVMSMADEPWREIFPNWLGAVPDGSQIVSRWYEVYGTGLSSKVIPTFKSILSVQLKGLLLLGTGWANTPQQPNLADHTNHLLGTIAAMNGWWASVVPEPAVTNALKISGPRLSKAQQAGPWLCYDSDRASHDTGPEQPFDDAWIFWVRERDPQNDNTVVDLVQAPWTYGTCAAALSVANTKLTSVDRDGHVRDFPYYYQSIGTAEIAPPTKSAAPPDVLVKFLADLPTTRAQLESQPD